MSLFSPRDGAMWICTAFGRKVLFAFLSTSLCPNFSSRHLHVNVHQMKCPNAFANYITCLDKKLFGFCFCPIIMESFFILINSFCWIWSLNSLYTLPQALRKKTTCGDHSFSVSQEEMILPQALRKKKTWRPLFFLLIQEEMLLHWSKPLTNHSILWD